MPTDNVRLNPADDDTGPLMASEAVVTLNGQAAPAGLQAQRVKLVLGTGGALHDVGDAHPVPVEVQALPLPAGAATQATLSALHTAAVAIQAAAEALNAKAVVVNTGAVAGTVALDAPTLAALESIQATTGGLTDAQLRAAPVPVSGAALDAVQALLTTLAAVVKPEDTAGADGDPGLVLLMQRRDTDATAVDADGDYATLKGDEEGRLKVSAKPASYPDITGDITAVQATANTPVAGGTVTADVSRASNVMLFCKGTFAGVNCTFEGSLEATGDDAWFGLQALRSNANTIETATGALSAAPAYAWEMSVNGLARVRVRCTARTSGTQSWRIKLGTYATEPIPAAQVSANQPITHAGALAAGTARVGFQAAAGIWYDDTSTALAANATFTGTSRDATVTATATAWANAATYAQEVVASAEQDVSFTLALEVSRDNATWRRVKTLASAAVSGGGHYAEIVHRPSWRYWRVLVVNGATAAARTTVGSIAKAA